MDTFEAYIYAAGGFFSPDQSDTDIDCRHFLVQNAGKYGDK
jgi:hypothetical protein